MRLRNGPFVSCEMMARAFNDCTVKLLTMAHTGAIEKASARINLTFYFNFYRCTIAPFFAVCIFQTMARLVRFRSSSKRSDTPYRTIENRSAKVSHVRINVRKNFRLKFSIINAIAVRVLGLTESRNRHATIIALKRKALESSMHVHSRCVHWPICAFVTQVERVLCIFRFFVSHCRSEQAERSRMSAILDSRRSKIRSNHNI